ncbi:MAG: hypothetical protein G8237_06795 [Magnetococcales bacterium]|nr:hypothetical protein [Magnetococcales bacterium]NGZ06048.1 hypothetical protein [Magnetococcales bacterium]
MKRFLTIQIILGISALMLANPLQAERPAWAGKGGGKEPEQHTKHPGRGEGTAQTEVGFKTQDHETVRSYFARELKQNQCPPGLAKKNQGCLPPGQAKKWTVGQPLPRDVAIQSVPPELIRLLGGVTPEYRYVRVAADILKIAVLGNRVVDAIQDLGQK